MARQYNSRQGRIYSWAVAGVFGLVILVVTLLAFLRPLQFDVEEPPGRIQAAEDGGVQAALELAPVEEMDCSTLIEQALQASDQDCQRIGRNEVCYGNRTVDAYLASGSGARFDSRGDVIPVDILHSLFTAPLDPSNEDWGVAVFKLQATLPSTVPGQNVTFLVFGDTSVKNQSGDMNAFFFSTGFGQVACEAVPLNGVVVEMPDGTGITFQANGAELTLVGTAVMEATPSQAMTVTMLDGSAMVSADGQSQYFGAGSAVNVPLGGDDGLGAAGPPSDPVPLSTAMLDLSCAVTGLGCDPDSIVAVLPQDAQAMIQAALGGGTLTGSTGGTTGSTTGGADGGDGGDDTSGGTTTGGDSGDSGHGCGSPPCGNAYGQDEGGPPGAGGDGGGGNGGGGNGGGGNGGGGGRGNNK